MNSPSPPTFLISSPQERLAAARAKLQEIVEVEGIDAGVIYLSSDATFKDFVTVDGKTVSIYQNQYFSPLGDALIELWKILKED